MVPDGLSPQANPPSASGRAQLVHVDEQLKKLASQDAGVSGVPAQVSRAGPQALSTQDWSLQPLLWPQVPKDCQQVWQVRGPVSRDECRQLVSLRARNRGPPPTRTPSPYRKAGASTIEKAEEEQTLHLPAPCTVFFFPHGDSYQGPVQV